MDDRAALSEAIRRVFPASRLEPATAEKVAAIRRRFPDVPPDYLEFLQRVGWGSLGDSNFMVYSGPCEPGDVFDAAAAEGFAGLVFVGDNFGGWMVGFDTRQDWRLVGVDSGSSDPEPYPLEQETLADFIARRIADREEAT